MRQYDIKICHYSMAIFAVHDWFKMHMVKLTATLLFVFLVVCKASQQHNSLYIILWECITCNVITCNLINSFNIDRSNLTNIPNCTGFINV